MDWVPFLNQSASHGADDAGAVGDPYIEQLKAIRERGEKEHALNTELEFLRREHNESKQRNNLQTIDTTANELSLDTPNRDRSFLDRLSNLNPFSGGTAAIVEHATYQGPMWPPRDAGTLQWVWTGVVWAGGYAVFTYEDFVREWKMWDGSFLSLFEPNRLLRTFLTIAVTVALTYTLPLIDVMIRMVERFYRFVLFSYDKTSEAWARIQEAWNQWLTYLERWRR